MKLTYRDIDPFLKHLDPAMRAVLVYGPDAGLVQERAKLLCKQVVSDLNDPFNAVHLDGDTLAGDPARLPDEANAQSLMGGRRLVRITAAGNDIAPALKSWLKGEGGTPPNPDCVIILEAGDLKPKDALRKLAEAEKNAAALPCYVEDERSLSGFIRDTVRAGGYAIQSDAVAWLASAIKGDRMRARMEVEKLLIYMAPDPATAEQKTITLADAQASCGDAGEQGFDDLVYAFMEARHQQALHAYARMQQEEVAPISIIRALQNHVLRLHYVKTRMEIHQQPLADILEKLQPQIFYKQKDQFVAQLRQYTLPRLHRLLTDLNDLEARTKQTGTPVDTLLGQFLLRSG